MDPYVVLLNEASIVEQQATETLTIPLLPDAWRAVCLEQTTPRDLKDRIIQRVKEIVREMTKIQARNNSILASAIDDLSQPIDTLYSPKQFG